MCVLLVKLPQESDKETRAFPGRQVIGLKSPEIPGKGYFEESFPAGCHI